MPVESSTIVQRFWNFCHILRDDGVSYGDYVEQLTYLLFLKMADEKAKLPGKQVEKVPKEFSWPSLVKLEGHALEIHYRHILDSLGKGDGVLGTIFRKAQNKIQDPAKLRRLVSMIDGENWSGLELDVKGAIYEGLLQKNAEEVKSGAGQHFTPRALIRAIVECIRPKPGQTICDPACGTGGFFLAAHEYISSHYQLDRDQKKALRRDTFRGWELVDDTARLCAMNLFLHGIGDGRSLVTGGADSLARDPGDRFYVIMTNPPFGKKSSITVVGEGGKAARESIIYERADFWATTSNKQLNFLQHVNTLCDIHGQVAIVVPDNVLFEGGAGETVRRKLLHACDVHTLLRLPTGIFYAQGVKANVLFFDRKPASETAWTKRLWIYDFRTNKHFTLRTNLMRDEDLQDFIRCYNPENRHERAETERFRAFDLEALLARDKISLDIFWLKDDSLEDTANLPEPSVLASEIIDNLQVALQQFEGIRGALNGENGTEES